MSSDSTDSNLPDLSPKGQQALLLAKKNARLLKHDFITTEHILLGILDLSTCSAVNTMILKGIDIDGFKQFIIDNLKKFEGTKTPQLNDVSLSPRAGKIIASASSLAADLGHDLVTVDHILLGILKSDSGSGHNIFVLKGIDVTSLYDAILREILPKSSRKRKALQKSGPGPSQTDTSPHVNTKDTVIDKYATNLTALALAGEIDPIVGREEELDKIIQILIRRQKNNPVLVGSAGVGKTAIVELLAKKIVDGQVPSVLADKEIYTLDLTQLVAGTMYRGQFEERLKKIINFIQTKKDTILFIDEIHMLNGAGSASGSMDASNILKPALSRGKISCIGATTDQEYKESIETDSALERRFQSVHILEPTNDEVVDILKGIKHVYEDHHNVKYSTDILKYIVTLSDRYITDRNFPDKAIDVLDEVGSMKRHEFFKGMSAQAPDKIEAELLDIEAKKIQELQNENFDKAAEYRKKERKLNEIYHKRLKSSKSIEDTILLISKEDIANYISISTDIPASDLQADEFTVLNNLSNRLNRKIIGQRQGVKKVCDSLKRSRVGICSIDKPICTFLFLGPTGVGKSHLARALGEDMYDSNCFKQFDMSEYVEAHSISKLIGAPPGYVGSGEGGILTEFVRKNPYSVLLFDEVEKAHPDVVQVFLQLFEYGMVTDSDGLEVNFKNTIVIMTSNVGAQKMVKSTLGFGTNNDPVDTRVIDELKQQFKPEFINRIDEVVIFTALEKDKLRKICDLLIKETKRTFRDNNGTVLDIDTNIIDYILDQNDEPEYGARPLKRLITSYLETPLADFIIKNKIQRAKKIKCHLDGSKVSFELIR